MRHEGGVALLEVLVALTIVSVAGLGVLEALHEGIAAEHAMAARERDMASAHQLLADYALLDRRDLEQRIGSQKRGRQLIRVQRPTATLFRVAVADTTAPNLELLVTILYRPMDPP